MKKRLTLEDCQRAAEGRGGKCLSTEYVNSRVIMEWECSEGHVFHLCQNSVHNGRWCRICSIARRARKRSLGDHGLRLAQETAKKRGGKCLSTEYISAGAKMKWRCSEGHVWEACFYNVVRYGTWCIKCAGKMKHTLDDCETLAEKNEGEFLGKGYKNTLIKMPWRCKYGHEFEMNYHSVRSGIWCPKCGIASRSKKRNLGEKGLIRAREIAEGWGGKCLSEEYVHSKAKMVFECKEGHIFEMSYSKIFSKGYWCPVCKISVSQQKLVNIIQDILPQQELKINFRGFDWLRNPETNYPLEVDIWIPDLKIAVEFDGEHHFLPIRTWGGEELLETVRARDQVKNDLIAKRVDEIKYFIRFNYKDKLTKKLVKDRIFDVMTNPTQ